jgi:hypothetical protein
MMGVEHIAAQVEMPFGTWVASRSSLPLPFEAVLQIRPDVVAER